MGLKDKIEKIGRKEQEESDKIKKIIVCLFPIGLFLYLGINLFTFTDVFRPDKAEQGPKQEQSDITKK